MGASFLKADWLIPPQLKSWQRTGAAEIRRKVPKVKDVVWVFSSGTQSVNRVKCIGLSHEAILESAKAVNTHLQADRIVVNPTTGCVSMGSTPTYTATVFNTTAPGCTVYNPCDITSSVGTIKFFSSDPQVMTNNATTGVLTVSAPLW